MKQPIQDKIHDFFASSPHRSFRRGQIIVLPDQEPPGVIFLQKGTVEQYDISSFGNKIVVNLFRAPSFFPMSWAINRTPNTFFYGATDDVEVRIGKPDDTVAFLNDNPDVALDLLSRVYKGTDWLLRRIVVTASDVAAKRLMFELLIDAYRFGAESGEGKKIVKLRQGDIAARSGLARETVSRELQKLVSQGVIERSKAGILIDTPRLEALLDAP